MKDNTDRYLIGVKKISTGNPSNGKKRDKGILKEFLVGHFSEVKSLGKCVVFKSFMKKKKGVVLSMNHLVKRKAIHLVTIFSEIVSNL